MNFVFGWLHFFCLLRNLSIVTSPPSNVNSGVLSPVHTSPFHTFVCGYDRLQLVHVYSNGIPRDHHRAAANTNASSVLKWQNFYEVSKLLLGLNGITVIRYYPYYPPPPPGGNLIA